MTDHYLSLKERVSELALEQGRDPSSVKIVVVSKTRSWQEMLPVYEAGCRDFGENRVQEALKKQEEGSPEIQWHLIGTLQKNKVSKVIGRFALIHSVDDFELAKKISDNSLNQDLCSAILLQVNTSQEITKQGFSCEEWRACFEKIMTLKGVLVRGLMTMAPLTDDGKVIRHCFASLRRFRDELEVRGGCKLPELSMGMTHDYPWAIVEGATLVRLGRAVFE